MKTLLLTTLLWMITYPTAAHDIGVSQTKLIEQTNNSYQLSVQAGPALIPMFAAPTLPDQCQPRGNPRGVHTPGWLSFEFTCTGPLTATDTLLLPWRRDGIMLTVTWSDGRTAQRLFSNEAGNITVSLAELQASSGSWIAAAERYLFLGIEHILFGIDHLLFVLALLLIVRGPWMLVKTITAFTVAHSITLGLATLGVVFVPSRPVEAVIALSIVFLCVEIVHAQRGRTGITFRYPWVVAFAFGLLHGLGFAGALSEIGLAQTEIPIALLFFNLGVETGQLLFVGVILIITWGLKQLKLNTKGLARQASAYVIGTLAAYWLLERIVKIFALTNIQ